MMQPTTYYEINDHKWWEYILHIPYWCASITVSIFAFIQLYNVIDDNNCPPSIYVYAWFRTVLGAMQLPLHLFGLMPARFSEKYCAWIVTKSDLLGPEKFYTKSLQQCNIGILLVSMLSLIMVYAYHKCNRTNYYYELATFIIWASVLVIRVIGGMNIRKVFWLKWPKTT